MKNKETSIKEFTVQPMNKDFMDGIMDRYEEYVLVQSGAIKEIFGEKFSNGITENDTLDGLVKISNPVCCCKFVYRRVKAKSVDGLVGGNIQMAYRTRCMLGAKVGDKVKVSKASGLAYMWHHPDTAIRITFRLAIFAFFASTALAVVLKII